MLPAALKLRNPGYAAARAVPFDFRRIVGRARRKTHSAVNTLLQ